MPVNRRVILASLAAIPVSGLTAYCVQAQTTPPVYAELGIAIDGTDPVGYFKEKSCLFKKSFFAIGIDF